jgi:hypothetical protein
MYQLHLTVGAADKDSPTDWADASQESAGSSKLILG